MSVYRLPDIPLSVVGKPATLRCDGLTVARGTITELVLTGSDYVPASMSVTFDRGAVKTWHNTEDDITLEVND